MQSRIARLQSLMGELGLDAYYCRNTSDIRWITGFAGVFDTEKAHLALVTGTDNPSECVLHTDTRYSEAMRANPSLDGLEISDELLPHIGFASKRLASAFQSASRTVKIGIEDDLPLNEYRVLKSTLKAASQECDAEFELVECPDPVLSLREVKDGEEADLMRRAQQITDKTFEDLLGWIAPGITEMQVASEMEYRMRRFGATGIAFNTIVASGFHSAMPHAVPSEKPLEKGDLVVLDFGAKYGDYCSDMTRTIAIGDPGEEQRRIYDLVLKAHETCKAMVAPGVKCCDVHNLAAKIISDGGYPKGFTHSLGHGVGIDIHEMPVLARRFEQPLVVGNVVTVEPGIYVPGLGGVRIEDFGIVVENGFEDFTSSPHELQVV